jgi:diphosphate--fructose-6-phosphate 1-phosphotransferase
MLGRSRDVVRTKELDQVVETCTTLKLDGLVVVGGATSNGYAATMAEYLHGKVATSVVGVPVSIDNGLVGKFCEAMVGFDTAARCYAQLIGNLATDAASAAKYYYFVRVMGRDTSHLAVECALQTGPTMVLTCEEVMSKNMSLADIVNQIADVVQARKAQGLNYGVIIVPEGLVGCIAEMRLLFKEVAAKAEGLTTPRPQTAAQMLTPWARAVLEGLPPAIQEQVLLSPEESTGGAQLQNIETDRLLAELVQAEVKRRNAKSPFSPVCFYLGYQARGAFPSQYDCVLGSTCGYAAGLFVRERLTGYLATVQRSCQKVEDWTVRAVPLAALLATQPDPYNSKNTRHVCPILPVDMRSTAYLDLQEKREDWQVADAFRNPGPTQFVDGLARPISLVSNTQKAHALLDDVMERCDAIKAALEAAAGDQLHIAQVSLAALQEVLAALGRR